MLELVLDDGTSVQVTERVHAWARHFMWKRAKADGAIFTVTSDPGGKLQARYLAVEQEQGQSKRSKSHGQADFRSQG